MPQHTRTYAEVVRADRRPAADHHRPPDEPADIERLLRAAADRDEDAWVSLVQRFTTRIRGVGRAHRLNAHDIEDVVQTTWLRLLENIERVRDAGALGAWLHTTAHRESLRVTRTRQREVPVDGEVLDRSAHVESDVHVETPELMAALAQALQALPERAGTMMRMLLAESAPSYAEVSGALGMPIGSIGPTRQRCVDRLRSDRRLLAARDS